MKSIFCIIKDKNQAQQAVEQLKQANISNISILCKCSPENNKQQQSQQQPRGRMQSSMEDEEGSWEREEPSSSYRSQSQQPQRKQQGAQSGRFPGLNAINVPGLGQVEVSGQFQNLLRNPSGANPIANALKQLGIPENQATKLLEKINRNSNVLLLIQADSSSDLERAREILEDCNASDIAMAAEKAGAGGGKKSSQQW